MEGSLESSLADPSLHLMQRAVLETGHNQGRLDFVEWTVHYICMVLYQHGSRVEEVLLFHVHLNFLYMPCICY